MAGELKEVVAICGTFGALAALREDGTVATWGHAGFRHSSHHLREKEKKKEKRKKKETKRERRNLLLLEI